MSKTKIKNGGLMTVHTTPPTPPQKLNISLQEHQMNIYLLSKHNNNNNKDNKYNNT